MKIRRVHIVVAVFCGVLSMASVSSQELNVADVLSKATLFYTNQDQYRVEMKFTMFRGFTGDKRTESYMGTMERNGNFSRNAVLNTTVYQFEDSKIIVDEDVKTVTYVPTDNQSVQSMPIDLKVFLDYFKESQLIDMGDNWLCEMVSTRKNFREVPYGKVLLHIKKDDFSITRQELFFSQKIPFTAKNGNDIEYDFGKLVLELSHIKNATIETSTLADFVVKSSANDLRLNEAYGSYQLINTTEENN